MTTTDCDLGDDLTITDISRRTSGGGTWASGRLAGHKFDVLVFAEHAENAEWELGQSRISKLCVRRQADKRWVLNWDRGLDLPRTPP